MRDARSSSALVGPSCNNFIIAAASLGVSLMA